MNGLVRPSVEGTPQGGPLSPLLSNLVLDELDKELERRGHRFVRYADDCVPGGGGEANALTKGSAVLCKRWREVLRSRPSGAGSKPPQAADGQEPWW